MITFKKNFEVIKAGTSQWPDFAIKTETMFFGADCDYVISHCGPITTEFMSNLPQDFLEESKVVIDSKVHMLMKDWMPCIGGWHIDDIPRTTPSGQPNYRNPEYKSEHVAAVFGDCSFTEFLDEDIKLKNVPLGDRVYKQWNTEINCKSRKTYKARNGEMIRFGYGGFHRGTPAIKSGWRLFIRASINTERKVVNEIRHQSQVYLPAI